MISHKDEGTTCFDHFGCCPVTLRVFVSTRTKTDTPLVLKRAPNENHMSKTCLKEKDSGSSLGGKSLLHVKRVSTGSLNKKEG